MRHPTDGTLRRLLDEPAGVADADREHVAGCPVCLSGLAAAQEDAAVAGAALDVELDVDVDAGWQRLSHAVAVDGRRRGSGPPRPPRRAVGAAQPGRRRARRRRRSWPAPAPRPPPTGCRSSAPSRIAPVPITQADLVELPDLSAYGELEVVEEADVREVADAAAAEEATGLEVPRVDDLPRGVTGRARVPGGRPGAARCSPSRPRGRGGRRGRRRDAAAAAAGPRRQPVPAERRPGPRRGLVRGARRAGAGRGRAVAPTAYSSGVPFETARDYLLSLPGLPEDVAAQLRGFSGDGTTLPLPVPGRRDQDVRPPTSAGCRPRCSPRGTARWRP